MVRELKQSKLWTVRNRKGQFIAQYRAFTAEQAIARTLSDDARTASTFRKSQPSRFRREDFVASEELANV